MMYPFNAGKRRHISERYLKVAVLSFKIGGISESKVRAIAEAGTGCLAVVSVICSTSDPSAATVRLRNPGDSKSNK